MLIDVKKVIHCDCCDTRHDTREAAIKCCGVMRPHVYYECSLCRRFFAHRNDANTCVQYHSRIQEIRKDDLAEYATEE